MKTFVQYGAGNIGRGFIGALFSNAGYHVKFIDVNKDIINALNDRHGYTIEIVTRQESRTVCVRDVCGVDGSDGRSAAQAIKEADIMATAVGVNVLPKIAPNIAEGLKLRWSSGNRMPLNIIICENLLDANKLLHKLINEHLDEVEKGLFDMYVGLVEASIGRMVPVISEESRNEDCLFIRVEKYDRLPLDKSGIRGELPDIPGLYPFSPFDYYIRRKLYIHNMGHGLTAYTGFLLKRTYIWQAIEEACIKLLVRRAMTESARALSRHYGVSLEDILEHIDDLLLRFGNKALGDSVARVGRDTGRKLSSSDRFAGAIKLCESEGIKPVYICIGVAAGLFFTCEKDEGTEFVAGLLRSGGIDAVLTRVCGLELGSESMRYIKEYYDFLEKGGEIKDLIYLCESFEEDLLSVKNIV